MLISNKEHSKAWLLTMALLALFLISACGKDNGQDSVVANAPRNCQTDAYGNCAWGTLPPGWNNYYSGYQGGNVQCPQGTYPLYREGWQPACAPLQQPQQFWPHQGGYQYCNVLYPNCPHGGQCIPYYQAYPPYASHYNNGHHVSHGVCAR